MKSFAANYVAATNRTRVYAGPITFAYNITSYNVTHGFDQVIPFQVPSYYTPFAEATTPATLTATLSGAHRSAALTIKATLPPVGVGEPGLWDVEKVPNTPDQLYGAWSSIAMFNNEPWIAYQDSTGVGTVKYAHFDGANWLTHLVDPTTPVGLYSTSIALDSWGAPHFSFYEQHTLPGGILRGSLRYATLAKPQILISGNPDGLIELVWPSEPQGFELLSTTDLSASIWQPWNATVGEFAGEKKVVFGLADPKRFFRLKR